MVITKDIKMADVIHKNHHLLSIINRFGIPLGFGDKTVEECCTDKNIEVDFFLDIINSYLDDHYFPKKHLAGFSSSQILNYLTKTHEFYLNEKIPLIENLINQLVKTSQAANDQLILIQAFFRKYKEELIEHTKKEEEEVYPYILEVENLYNIKKENTNLPESIQKYSIQFFADEHDNMEEKLFDLKNILIKYLPQQDDQILLRSIITELFELEKDLADHSKIEDKVLIPKIAEMEKIIRRV